MTLGRESSFEYEYDGHKYFFDKEFVWSLPGELHPKYVVYSKLSLPEKFNMELWELKVKMGIESMLHHLNEWTKEADDRGGLPPGVKKVAEE